MAILPDASALGQPADFRSGRPIASGPTDYVGPAIEDFGAAVQALAPAFKARQNEDDAVNNAKAIDGYTTDAIKIDDQFDIDKDSDYATYGDRAKKALEESKNRWASTIRDPRDREKFLADIGLDVEKRNLTITGRGAKQGRLANLENANDTLDSLARTAISSNDPDAQKRSIQAAHDLIDKLEKEHSITASEATKWRRESANSIARLKYEADAVADPEGTLKKLGVGNGDLQQQAGALLRKFEGIDRSAKWDVDAWRLGYGSDTITDDNGKVRSVRQGDTISQADAERDLQRRLPDFIRVAKGNVGAAWDALPTRSQAVLVSLEYNYKNGLRNKALAGVVTAAQSGNPEALAHAIETLPPGSQDPQIAKGLQNRRNQEAAIVRGQAGIEGGGNDNVAVDPMLKPEDVIALRAKARAQMAAQDQAQRAAAAAESASVKGTYSLGIQTGELDNPNSFLNDNRIDDGDKAVLMSAWNAKHTEEAKTTAALARVKAGDTFMPFTADDRTDAGRVYDAIGGVTGLLDGDAKAAGRLGYVVDKTGIVPPQAISALRSAMSGPNAKQAAAAYQIASDLYGANPRIFDASDGGDGLRSAAESYAHMTKDWGMSGEAAAKRLQEAYDPNNKRTVENLKESTDAFVKSLDPSSVAGQFSNIFADIWGGGVATGTTPEQSDAFAADVREIARTEFVRAHGDPDAARAATAAQIKSMYGVTTTNGRRVLMRWAPELRYPEIDNSHDYLRPEALAFAAHQTGLPIGPKETDGGVKDKSIANVALVATRDTVQDFKDRNPTPRYDLVVWTWKDGQKVLGDVVHGFSVTPARLLELDKARQDRAQAQHDSIRLSIDAAKARGVDVRSPIDVVPPSPISGAIPGNERAQEALRARRDALDAPQGGAPTPAPTPTPAPAAQPSGPLNESGLPSNAPQRSKPGSTVTKPGSTVTQPPAKSDINFDVGKDLTKGGTLGTAKDRAALAFMRTAYDGAGNKSKAEQLSALEAALRAESAKPFWQEHITFNEADIKAILEHYEPKGRK